uniref:Uncharacterized protein n=1 Tax=Meloidogyne incognita TaxID=6306 RepID=A0A914MHP7_MELIC
MRRLTINGRFWQQRICLYIKDEGLVRIRSRSERLGWASNLARKRFGQPPINPPITPYQK